MRSIRRALAVFAWASGPLALAAALPIAAQPSARPLVTLPVALSVAPRDDGAPVVGDDWLDEQVTHANAIFAPHGLAFRRAAREGMDRARARLETREDRHALGRLLHARVIDCFFVESLRDVDEPERFRMGVHWRPRGVGAPAGAHFVIVSSIAGPTVLAHELGHYFGNPHSSVAGNIMSYDRGAVPPFFDDVQGRRIRRFARGFLDRGELALAASAP